MFFRLLVVESNYDLKTIFINYAPHSDECHNNCFVDWQFVLKTPKPRKLQVYKFFNKIHQRC